MRCANLRRDLALARRKRGIAAADMAGRLFISRDTLWVGAKMLTARVISYAN
jgi:hypothetical protein